MSSENQRVPLAGSEKVAMPGSRVIASANPDEVIQVSVRLRPRTALNPSELQKRGAQTATERQHLTHEEYEQQHGASPDDIAKVEQFAHESRLAVVTADSARRTVVLSGTVATFSSAFDVDLKQYEHEGTRFRGRVGAIHIPRELSGIITGVMLAFARVAGETAPLLFTAFGNQFWNWRLDQPTAALSLQIYTYALSPFDDWHRQAWAGSLVLIVLIVGAVAAVRIVVHRGKLAGA